MVHIVGIDISKAKFDTSHLFEGKPKNRIFKNDADGINKFVDWLPTEVRGSVHLCMEGTGRYWELLAEELNARGLKVSVVNPMKVKGFAQSQLRRSKTDKLDAQTIAKFCLAHNPPVWTPPTPQRKSIRDKQHHVLSLKEMRTQEKNRLQSGVREPLVLKFLTEHIDYINKQIELLENQIRLEVQADEKLTQTYQLLVTIPGVGETTALTVLSELDFDNFAKARELEVFCGIAPRLRESGSSIRGRSRMSKVGNRIIRKQLYMPALAAMRFNKPLRQFAERLKKSGKRGQVIVCAVMRRLLRLMFAVVKSRKPFNPDHVSKPVPRPN